jgi:two-component system, chemotaxis family, response regulator Rcp1
MDETIMESNKPVEILLVEDNPGDVHLITKALKAAKVFSNLNVVTNGVEAIAFLYRQGEYMAAPRPNLILLDLNLPKKNGREVLTTIKHDPNLLRIPVVILTSSAAEQDILQAYNLHANSYVTKPLNLKQFLSLVKSIREYWLTITKLPLE